MALSKIPIPSGLRSDRSDYSAGPVWVDGNKIRFQQNEPEPIGGWESYPDFNVTNGVPSDTHIWRDLSGNDCMVVGTEERLTLFYNGTSYDITPIRATSANQNNCFTTTNTSTTVSVLDTSHLASVGDWVDIDAAAAVGGITPDGLVQVTEVTDADNWKFEWTSAATSSVSGGGGAATDLYYLLATGNSTSTAGLGWGADTWGAETWGTARSTSNISLEPNLWSFDNWGEDLVACRRGGLLYTWDASAGPGTRATAISNAPTTAKFVLVSVPDRHLIAFGAHDGSADDPLNIAWPDRETLTTWTPSVTNTAGNQRLHLGDYLVAAIQTRDQILVWTDEAMFAMLSNAGEFVFSFRALATGCSPASQNSVIDQNGKVYWMGCHDFYHYTGTAEILPCPVRDHVFNDINRDRLDLVFAGTNRRFTEVWYHYPSSSAVNYPDRYVALNYMTGEWTYGTLGRVVWFDSDSWLTSPGGYDENGNFYYHEKGKSADGSAMNWSVESGTIEIPEAGDHKFLIDRYVSDISQQTGDVTLTMYYKNYPNDTESSKTYTISSTTEKTSTRVKGRELRLGYSSSAVESFAKLGSTHRIDWHQSSRR
jgi:hypothetical protein